jgi:hypothetical protein
MRSCVIFFLFAASCGGPVEPDPALVAQCQNGWLNDSEFRLNPDGSGEYQYPAFAHGCPVHRARLRFAEAADTVDFSLEYDVCNSCTGSIDLSWSTVINSDSQTSADESSLETFPTLELVDAIGERFVSGCAVLSAGPIQGQTRGSRRVQLEAGEVASRIVKGDARDFFHHGARSTTPYWQSPISYGTAHLSAIHVPRAAVSGEAGKDGLRHAYSREHICFEAGLIHLRPKDDEGIEGADTLILSQPVSLPQDIREFLAELGG